MVFFVNEKAAAKIFKKYPNCTAYTYLKSHKKHSDPDVKMDYVYMPEIVPSADEISAVVSGDMSAKKIINKMIKAINNPVNQSGDVVSSLSILTGMINLMADHDNGRPSVVVFIAEDAAADGSKVAKEANKFVLRWLEEMFGEFGIPVISKSGPTKQLKFKKVYKKIFKAKGNDKKKKIRKKIRKFDTEFVQVDNAKLAVLNTAYRPEIQYTALNTMIGISGAKALKAMGKKRQHNISKDILAMLLRRDYDVYAEFDLPKKKLKKYMKDAIAADKDMLKNYKYFYKTFELISAAAMEKAKNEPEEKRKMSMKAVKKLYPKLPKISKKLSTAKETKKVQQKIQHIVNFYSNRKNVFILAALYAHIVAMRAGMEYGDASYNKAVTEMLALDAKRPGLADAYKSMAKKIAAELAKAAKQ